MADYSISAALESARDAAKKAAASVQASVEAARGGNTGLADQLLAQSHQQGQQAQALVDTSVAAANGNVAAQQALAAHQGFFGALPWWAKLTLGVGTAYVGYRVVKRLARGRGGRRGRR